MKGVKWQKGSRYYVPKAVVGTFILRCNHATVDKGRFRGFVECGRHWSFAPHSRVLAKHAKRDAEQLLCEKLEEHHRGIRELMLLVGMDPEDDNAD